MLDQNNGHIGRKGFQDADNVVPLLFGDTGCRFVQQQNLWLAGKGKGDFKQSLLAVGQMMGRDMKGVPQTKLSERFNGFRYNALIGACHPPPVNALSVPF